jgi:hypothetical protein
VVAREIVVSLNGEYVIQTQGFGTGVL